MTELFTGFTPPEELVLKPIQDEILNQVITRRVPARKAGRPVRGEVKCRI